jgi:hypothetical protein
MVLIQLTGNFAFFNLLGVALSLLLLDDRVWLQIYRLLVNEPLWQAAPPPGGLALLSGSAAILVLVFSIDSVARLFRAGGEWPRLLARLFDLFEPFHFVNSYGLFAVMTTWRPEIMIEGSYDGRNWKEYEFKWKPGDVCRGPRFVAPHQPRLDWQMWFAALGRYDDEPWFQRFCQRLLEGSPQVLRLLAHDPFGGRAPRYLRATLYRYRFSDPAARRTRGVWWTRERLGEYSPVLSLDAATPPVVRD